MNKIFNDAYKSQLSCVIIEDIERLIEFTHFGQRFTNSILQDLLVNLKRKPSEPDRKILIIGTTSIPEVMEELEVAGSFYSQVKLQWLTTIEEKMKVIEVLAEGDESKISFMKQVAEDQGNISVKHLIHTLEWSLLRSWK